MKMHIDKNETLLFIGDSITDCGRGRPVGQKPDLGNGYVSMAAEMLSSLCPDKDIKILNTGISGNRITDLKNRWQTDVLDLEPDWLSIMIGINDVWRQFDRPLIEQVDIEKYESIYIELLKKTVPFLKGLIMITPYMIEADKSNPMREQMDRYSEVVKRLASDFDAIYVDSQAAFDDYLASKPADSLCSDSIHPNSDGHKIIADAFIAAVK